MTVTTLDIGCSKINTEGYLDLMSYHALKKLQREQFGYRSSISAHRIRATCKRTLSSHANSAGSQ